MDMEALRSMTEVTHALDPHTRVIVLLAVQIPIRDNGDYRIVNVTGVLL